MTARSIFRATVAATALLAAVGAGAATYHVTYTSTQSFGGPLALSGASLFITTAAGINGFGGHDITGVTGDVDGDIVTGLVPLDGPAGSARCPCFPAGYAAANYNFSVSNTFYDASPRFDHGGVGFVSGSTWYNLWVEGSDYWLASIPAGTPEILDGDYSQVSFSMGSGTVPEPASWALLIAGFGLTGAAMRRRERQVAA